MNNALPNYNPVTLICIVEEIGIAKKNGVEGQLWRDYVTLVFMIYSLIHEFGDSGDFETKTEPLSLGILYMPKIHFFYPLSEDFSRKVDGKTPGVDPIQVADLMSLQPYLSNSEK